jgi:hypothetical protein
MKQRIIQNLACIAIALPKNVLADRIYDIEIRDLFILFRYLIGFAFVVFGMFFLLYKDYAIGLFLKRYDDALKAKGLISSCNKLKGEAEKYKVEVVYSAALEGHQRRRQDPPATDVGGALLQQEYMYKFESNWVAPQGTTIDLCIIPGESRSAITEDMLEAERNKFSWANALTILLPGATLAVLFLFLCVHIITEFPRGKIWCGWVIFLIVSTFSVFSSWSICDYQFQHYALETYFSSYPVHRRDVDGNVVPPPPPPKTIFVPLAVPSVSTNSSVVTTDTPKEDPSGNQHYSIV